MKIINLIKRPKMYCILLMEKVLGILPDEQYIKLKYKNRIGKKLNLKNPQTYNEKLQWLKLYDRNPLYTTLVDKYEVKQYIADKIGEEYVVPLYEVWDSFDDIDFDLLPNSFVLKTTHDSGGVVICCDKSKFDIIQAKKMIRKSLSRSYYKTGREWPYKNVKPRIIAEKYLEEMEQVGVQDYKFFCFDGKVELMYIASDRLIHATKIDFFDRQFNRLKLVQHYPNSSNEIKKPKMFEKMIELAESLSKEIRHVRVDFYCIKDRIYFGELTFFNFGGMEKFEPNTWDHLLGEKLILPNQNIDIGDEC